ncbi:MAG TPA: Calx-beta domain-containing protein, partial [Pyrinomonadaceae bacterium]
MTPNTTRRLAAFAFALSLAIHFAGGTGATAPQPPGALSFSQAAYEVNEGGGSAAITLTRGGGTDGAVTARVGISNVTTNAADYRFTPGALDATFTPGTGPNNVVHDVLVQPDGKILIAGFFRSYAGVTRNNVARLLPSGALDTTFDPQLGPGEVFSMALQPDGKLVVGGVIFTPDGSSRNGIGRLNADGSVDATFTPGGGTGNHGIDTIALRPDGKILIGGNFVSYDGVAREGSARLNADGTLDPSFVPPAVFRVFDLLALPDNKVIVCGFFSQIAGVSRPGVARLNEDGSHDLTFVPDAVLNRQSVSTLARQPDGKIIVGGVIFIDQPPSMTSTPLARLNADGSFDPFFFDPGLGRLHFISAITLQPDGKVIVGGAFRTINNPLQDVGQFLHRLNTNGTIDGSFNSGITAQLNSAVEEVALQPDGKLVVGGQFTQPFPGPNVFLRRLQGDLFVTWPDGDAADKTVNLPIVDDLLGESAETLTLTLTPHTGGATTGTHPSATLTIIDNEVAPAITSAPPPGGITRTPYTHTFTATGSPAPTFSVTSGSLPPGLFLNPATGVLSGSPTAAGTFSNITVTAGNGVAPAATQTFSLNILSGGTLQFGTNALSVSEDGASATVTVTRNGGSAGAAAVNFSASNGTASGSGVDFTLVSGTLGFAEGETSKTFAVQITNDDVNERDETLNLFLSSVTGSASLGSPSNAVLTITNDDPLPTISIDDVVVNESDTGVRPAVFTVSRAGLIDRPVSFTASPADGTARANEDYAPFTFTFQIAPNTQSTTVIVNIAGDTITEPDENFVLNISAPINATIVDAQGAGEVKDNESPNTPPTVQFAAWNFNAPEADGAVNINVTRSGDISAPATVLYTT